MNAALTLAGLALATLRPVVVFTHGRLDAWAIHGLSPSRVDGVDPLQVALSGVLGAAALLGLFRPVPAQRPLAAALLLVVAARVLAHLALGPSPDWGLLGLALVGAGNLRGAPAGQAGRPPRRR